MSDNTTRALAEYCVGLRLDDLPTDVVEIATLSILDNFGCAFAGIEMPLVQIAADELVGRPVTARDVLPGAIANIRPHDRASLHALAGHAADFDDTLVPPNAFQSGHIGSAALGAAIAVSETATVTGTDLLVAFVAGYECVARIAAQTSPEHNSLGHHPTGTLGTFAAAATAAKLMGLDPDGTSAAFGIAATQTAGLKCSFGTMAKPLNAGHAAAAGVLGARLVSKGFTASTSALEHEHGFLALYRGLPADDRPPMEGSDVFRIRHNMFKLHASCLEVHPMIYALRHLMAEHGIAERDITRIDADVCPRVLKVAGFDQPTTEAEAKFSVNHAAACVLAGVDTASPSAYSEETVMSDLLTELRSRIHVRSDDRLPSPVRITLTAHTRSGATVSVDFDARDELTGTVSRASALRDKFRVNARPGLGDDGAEHLLEAIDSLEGAADAASQLSLR